jgi:predicted AlkP superfamily phosphohydrolase/phosphomutase
MTKRIILHVVLGALIALTACARTEESRDGTRLLLFGIDAATWNLLAPMIEAGELPVIEELVREGSSGILKTGEPIQSPQMWTSIATGKVPEKHGISRFVYETSDGRQVPVTGNMRKVKAFWNMFSERGLTVGIVGWWPSWPAEEVNGFMIAQRAWPINWSQHGIPFGASRDDDMRLVVKEFPWRTYPESLYIDFERFIHIEEDVTQMELDQIFGQSRYADPSRQAHARWVYAKDKTFAAAGLEYLQRFEPDLFAIYLQGPDVVSHKFWGYQSDMGFRVPPAEELMYARTIRNYYRFMDAVIERYLTLVDEDCAVLIVSDHGFETKEDLKPLWEAGEEVSTVEGGNNVPWDHAADGVYIFRGPGVRPGHWGEDASVNDITPTLLTYFGLPVARDMDGEPMTNVFEEGFLREHPIEYIDTYETGEPRGDESPMESPMDEGLKEKLRSLGYID